MPAALLLPLPPLLPPLVLPGSGAGGGSRLGGWGAACLMSLM